MASYDYIELPEEKIRAKDVVRHSFNTSKWPGKRFIITISWNNASQEFHFAIGLVGFGQIIPKSPVKLDQPYSYRDYIRFIFKDPSDKAKKVTPTNFANRIRATVWAGPESEAYEPVVEQTIEGEIEKEPWMDWIGYFEGTDVVEEPLPISVRDE